jgi:hypothetical protein
MEGNIEVKILMREEVSFFWGNGEKFAAEYGVPLEFGADISEVGELYGFCYF